jgi:hypothetical protein
MAREVTTWVEALPGGAGRGRPHTATTIASYLRAVAPALRRWGERHASSRQVSVGDVAACLEPLHGSQRTMTAVALRSMFGALKAHRLIFADPARSVRPGRFPRRPVLGLDDATRAGLLAQITRADHRLVVLLAAVHALPRADLAGLRVDEVDLTGRAIVVRGRKRPVDELTYHHLLTWLRERAERWPATANPHVLITPRSAYGVDAVSTGYFRAAVHALPVTVAQLRADRLLAEARDTGGDPLTLVNLFGVSDDTAVRYCAELGLLDERADHQAEPRR